MFLPIDCLFVAWGVLFLAVVSFIVFLLLKPHVAIPASVILFLWKEYNDITLVYLLSFPFELVKLSFGCTGGFWFISVLVLGTFVLGFIFFRIPTIIFTICLIVAKYPWN